MNQLCAERTVCYLIKARRLLYLDRPFSVFNTQMAFALKAMAGLIESPRLVLKKNPDF